MTGDALAPSQLVPLTEVGRRLRKSPAPVGKQHGPPVLSIGGASAYWPQECTGLDITGPHTVYEYSPRPGFATPCTIDVAERAISDALNGPRV